MAARPQKPGKAGPPPLPKKKAPTAPAVEVSYAPAGRETMAVIEEELIEGFPAHEPSSAPQISVGETALGRETLAAIAAELLQPATTRRGQKAPSERPARAPSERPATPILPRPPLESMDASATRQKLKLGQKPPPRIQQNTLDYAEPEVVPAPTMELTARTQSRTPTLRPLAGPAPPPTGPAAAPRPEFVIHEMVTFVVRSSDVVTLATPEARLGFVVERLMHRLPVKSAMDIERVDVTPWTEKGTVVVRVWCRVT